MDAVMQTHVDAGELHGCVTYVQKDGQVLLNKAYGFKDVEAKEKMDTEVIFHIASMAKTVVAAGALVLYEQGQFLLDGPVEKYLPELKDLQVMQNLGTDSSKLVPLNRSITIRDLFRHTAGFSYAYRLDESYNRIDSLYVTRGIDESKTSEEFLETLASIPLKYQPGSKWEYLL